MKLPSNHYYDLEFDGAPCPTVQEEMELNRVVAEGERLLRAKKAAVIIGWALVGGAIFLINLLYFV